MSRRDQIAEVLTGRWLSYGDNDGADDLVEHPNRDGARISAAHAHLLADALLPLVDHLRAEAVNNVIEGLVCTFDAASSSAYRRRDRRRWAITATVLAEAHAAANLSKETQP